MSFVFKNLDSSKPNLRVGEILDSELYNHCQTSFNLFTQSGYFNTGNGAIQVEYNGSTPYRFTFSYASDEYIDKYNVTGNELKKRNFVKNELNSILAKARQLYMPNYISSFPEMTSLVSATEEFEYNLKANVGGNRGEIMIFGGTGSNPPHIGGLYKDTDYMSVTEYLAASPFLSLGLKYWGDAKRTLESAKKSSCYVFVAYRPTPFRRYNSDPYQIGTYTLTITFAEYATVGSQVKGIFSGIDVNNVEHRNDLPDDQNTYPGGGDDKNQYPEDDPEGLNTSGNGTFDNTNNPVDFPSMPIWDATSTGFISMWNPTISEISQLYGFLWDSDISTTLKKLFLEPMDAIISLAFFPVDPVNFPEKRNVTIGHVDTEITMYAVQKQFVDFDFGTIKLDEYYGAAWDYSPYTKVSIYLPYIGSQELDVDDVMDANLHLQYRIDLLSGMCVAMLKCTRERDDLDAVVYTWQGNCAMQVPITAGSAREFINSIIQIGAMTGLALVQPAAGALAMGSTSSMAMSADIMSMKNNFVNPTMATYAALNVLGQKVHVQRGGRVDANAGAMSPQSAYIIIDRPISAIPKGWNEYAGYPSLKIKTLSSQKGMTQVAYIKLNGLEATAEEISELDSILKAGVIL